MSDAIFFVCMAVLAVLPPAVFAIQALSPKRMP